MKHTRSITMGMLSFAGLILLRQQCFAEAASGEAEAAASIDWVSELQKGGATGVALFVVAAAGVLFVVERLVNMRRSHIVGEQSVVAQAVALAESKDSDQAKALYQEHPSSFTKVVQHMAEHQDLEPAEVLESAADLAGRDIESHRRKIYGLGVVSTIAPLLGLLGTMVGMIEAFSKFSKLTDSSEAALVLGDSIGKALITTAVGLIIAIPSLAAFHYFKVRLGALADQLEAELDAVHRKWFRKNA
ncbi:MotA/TolQ/ExbB proton channel family protein [Rubritalea tangerina]|uniref:MotA/TolQ/ExbB proton channel family protein n=1 Tax=Rubritalea tangerina TaxID=430798 RepID=A0ABW4Z8A3_9BACT